MAFPVQISGISFAVARQLAPPFADDNGNLYFVGVDSGDDNDIVMMKSSDGGDSWSEVDSDNNPTGYTTVGCIDAFMHDEIIYIATQHHNGDLRISGFGPSDNTSEPDEWIWGYAVVANSDLLESDGYVATGCSIAVFDYSDIIIFYNGDLNSDDMATVQYAWYDDYAEVWYIDNEVSSNDDTHAFVHGATLAPGGNIIQLAWGHSDGWGLYALLYDEDPYLFDIADTSTSNYVSGRQFAGAKPVAYYDWVSDDDILTGSLCVDEDEGWVWRVLEYDVPGDQEQAADNDVQEHEFGVWFCGSWCHFLAVDCDEKTVYFIWAGTDDDIYYTKSVDCGSWTAGVELNDGVSVNERGGIVASVYENGFNVVLGYVYNNNGVLYYDELVLRTASLNTSVSDGISVSESVSGNGGANPSVSDGVAVSEYYRAVPPPLTPSVSDSVSVAENVGSVYISVLGVTATTENISASESVDIDDIPNPDISDSISTTDTSELTGGVNPDVSDNVSLAESIISSVLPIDISVSDSTSITEYVAEWSHVPIPVVASENIHITEHIAEEVYNPPISPRRTGIAVLYNVRLKNHVGVTTAIFDNFLRLEYELRVNDVGYYSLTFADDSDVRFSQFILDAQIEIWRSVPGQGVGFYKVFEGLHRKLNKTIAETGERLITFSGVGYNDLLARTIVAYKAGTIRADKNAPVETVMKEYVEENCGPTADDTVVGRLYQGYLPNFSVEPTAGGGPNWEGSRAFENLLDILMDIGQQTAVDFEVIGSGSAEFEFRTHVNQIGKDRRNVDLDSRGRNPAGNRPVIFSTDFGYTSDFSYTHDRMSEGNVVVVLGEGEGSTQTTITRSDEDAIIASPWNRCEVSRPGTSQEFQYQLEQLGDEVLEELKAQQIVEFMPMQQAAQMYGVHYDLGDRVTVKSEDIETHSKIIVEHVTFEQDAEQVEIELGDIPTPTSVYT